MSKKARNTNNTFLAQNFLSLISFSLFWYIETETILFALLASKNINTSNTFLVVNCEKVVKATQIHPFALLFCVAAIAHERMILF